MAATSVYGSVSLFAGFVSWDHANPLKRACWHVARAGCSHEKASLITPNTGRRSLLVLTSILVSAASAGPIRVAAKTQKVITNLEEAREEGERRREEKELTEGPIITLPSGVKFRELSRGSGNALAVGDFCSLYYTIYKLNGLYLDSLGYGKEGKNDVGDTFTFQYGMGLVPKAIDLGMEGMQAGGKRRILVRPELGWVSPMLLPLPTSNAAERRLNNNKKQPLLFEVELAKIRKPT